MNASLPITLQQAERALSHVPNNLPRDEWARCAMALKAEFGDVGFDVFARWSEGASNHDPKAVRATWASVKPNGGIGIGSLVYLAKQYGYAPAKTAPMTPGERSAFERTQRERETQRRAQEAKHEAETLAKHTRARDSVLRILRQAKPATLDHPYLQRKAFTKTFGVLQFGAFLAIAMSTLDGEVWNVQTISPNGAKRFYPAARRAGLVYVIGEPVTDGAPFYISEGWATGAALHLLTGHTCIVSFDVNALLPAALALRERCPNAEIIIGADFDEPCGAYPDAGGIGLAKAKAAAQAIGGRVVKPDGGRKDFADVWRARCERMASASVEVCA